MSVTSGNNNNQSTLSVASKPEQDSLSTEAFPGELDLLRLQSNQLNQLFDVMPAGVVIIDGDGIIVKANEVANDLLGIILLNSPWIDVIKKVFKPRADDGHEVSLIDGRRVKLDISSFSSQAGQLILITDLTETRLLQDQLSQMQRLSALGRMVSTLAHQIRTPLSAAILYCANLTSETLSKEKKESFRVKLGSRLHDLEQQVNDMLLFAKSGNKQVVTILNVETLVNNAAKTFESQLDGSNSKISIHIKQKNLQILGNKIALEGAIQNLINNALQVHETTVNVDIKVYSALDSLFIHVKDDGSGVESKNMNKIFEPFYTSKVEGTGLGLAVVKSVAKSHHGDVTLVSKAGESADFCIKLPLFQTEQNR